MVEDIWAMTGKGISKVQMSLRNPCQPLPNFRGRLHLRQVTGAVAPSLPGFGFPALRRLAG
jgi:hypothetical protein